MTRIGIFAGTFDPVHAGHIAFALQALEVANLDEVMFLPERRPRYRAAEHYGHRVAMLRRALKPHAQLSLLELVEPRFTVQRTLAHIRAVVGPAELVVLVGSDVVPTMSGWPALEHLLQVSELVVGVRAGESRPTIERRIAGWPVSPRRCFIFQSFAPVVSGGAIRQALQQGRQTAGLLTSVWRYSRQNWLYVALPQ